MSVCWQNERFFCFWAVLPCVKIDKSVYCWQKMQPSLSPTKPGRAFSLRDQPPPRTYMWLCHLSMWEHVRTTTTKPFPYNGTLICRVYRFIQLAKRDKQQQLTTAAVVYWMCVSVLLYQPLAVNGRLLPFKHVVEGPSPSLILSTSPSLVVAPLQLLLLLLLLPLLLLLLLLKFLRLNSAVACGSGAVVIVGVVAIMEWLFDLFPFRFSKSDRNANFRSLVAFS